MGLVLLILLIILITGAAPGWGYHAYGWGPSGILSTVLVVLLILMLLGRI